MTRILIITVWLMAIGACWTTAVTVSQELALGASTINEALGR